VILLTGATGSIGVQLAPLLALRKEPFRVLARDEGKGRALGGEVVVGDLDDAQSVAEAMVGVDRVFLNAGGAVPAPGEQPMVRQQKAVIDAARGAGVSHVVKVSVWGARPGGKLAEGAHWEIERYLKASGLPWTMLRPSGYMQNFVTGAGAFSDDGDLLGAYRDGRVAYIDCADIAACAAVCLAEGTGVGETLLLSGPEALSHDEIAARLTQALGRPVRYVDLPPEVFAARLAERGLPTAFAEDVAALFAEVAVGALASPSTTVRDLTGRQPRSFDEFLERRRQLAL